MKPILSALLAALTLSLPTASLAQETGYACSRIEADDARLACYDTLFRGQDPVGEELAVTLESEQLIPARPSGRDKARMVVACQNGTLSVRFSFAGQLVSGTGDFGALTTQIDAQTARTRTLDAAPDNLSLGFWTTQEAVAFLDSLVGFTNLNVRVTPANSRSLSVRFRLPEFVDAVAPVRAACDA